MKAVVEAVRVFNVVILGYFVVVGLAQTALLLAASLELRYHRRTTRYVVRNQILSSRVLPRISVLAPAHNEEATIVSSLTALLTLRYPQLEVVVVNDGSADDTIGLLTRVFQLEPVANTFRLTLQTAPITTVFRSRVNPRLVVVDKENGGKADALNAGLCVATGELVCAIDADTLIEPEALVRMVRPFLDRDDCVAAGGTIRVANGARVERGRVVEGRVPRTVVAGVQAVEYLRAFQFGRLGWNRLGGNLIISGAFGLFRRQDILAIGGYLHGSVGEDMEIVARLRRRHGERRAGRIRFIPDPVAWTEVPSTLRVLGRQRDRWHRGLTQTLWTYKGSWGNPRDGALGMIVYPYFVLIELLAPVVEAFGLLGLGLGIAIGAVNWPFAVAFFLFAYGYGIVLSSLAILLDTVSVAKPPTASDLLRLALWTVIEPIGFRQLTIVWRIRGIVRALRGHTEWGVMTRTGFEAEPAND